MPHVAREKPNLHLQPKNFQANAFEAASLHIVTCIAIKAVAFSTVAFAIFCPFSHMITIASDKAIVTA